MTCRRPTRRRRPRPTSPEPAIRVSTPFYLTTAIDYANGDPHLGHAFEKIGADTIARYQRQAGRRVHFLIGMDEHGQKVAQTAADRGVTPQAQVDEIAELAKVESGSGDSTLGPEPGTPEPEEPAKADKDE